MVQDGDIISIDINNYQIQLEVSDEELAKRRAELKPFTPKITKGYLARYAAMVTSASTGAVLKMNK